MFGRILGGKLERSQKKETRVNSYKEMTSI